MHRKSLLAATAIAAACVSSAAFAHSSMEAGRSGDLVQLADRSNLVFLGKVEKVVYRNAKTEGEQGLIPYTIVTYRVGEVLRGQSPGDTFTMRFVGGPDGRGGILTVSGVPVMQEGDQDLLFVAGNGEQTCPLVFCEHGRYRVLNNLVFDTFGSPVRAILKANVISRGLPAKPFLTTRFPAPSFDELIQNPEVQGLLRTQNLSPDQARARYEQGAPKFIEIGEDFPAAPTSGDGGGAAPVPETPGRLDLRQPGGVPPALQPRTLPAPAPLSRLQPSVPVEAAAAIAPGPIALQQFVSAVRTFARQSTRTPQALKSIDPNAEIVAPRLQIATPQRGELPRPRLQMSPADADEVKALEQNGFDPVIRR